MKEKDMEMEDEMEMEGPESEKEMGDMEVECAAQDLLRAEKVKADPKLYEKALAKLNDQKKMIESIDDIKSIYKKKLAEEKA